MLEKAIAMIGDIADQNDRPYKYKQSCGNGRNNGKSGYEGWR